MQQLWQETELIRDALEEVNAMENEGLDVEIDEMDVLGEYMEK